MLKQILATSALVAIAAVSAQTASAADNSKFRQLVVEAPGTPTPDLVIKKKKIAPTIAIKPSEGIPTPTGPADGGNKVAKFIVAPGKGLPTPVGTADVGNGQGGAKGAQFVVAPGGGLPTPPEAANKGKPQNELPPFVKAPGVIDAPVKVADTGADPTPPAASKSFPLIASAPSAIDTPPAAAAADDAPAVAALPADIGAPLAPSGSPAPVVAADPGTPAVDAAPAAPAVATPAPVATAAPAVANPNDLYKLLTTRGYGVEILKRDGASGNVVFYVTAPGSPEYADLLLVDGTYGKVIERKHIAAYDYTYEPKHPAPYTPRYADSYAGEDNCEETAGY